MALTPANRRIVSIGNCWGEMVDFVPTGDDYIELATVPVGSLSVTVRNKNGGPGANSFYPNSLTGSSVENDPGALFGEDLSTPAFSYNVLALSGAPCA